MSTTSDSKQKNNLSFFPLVTFYLLLFPCPLSLLTFTGEQI